MEEESEILTLMQSNDDNKLCNDCSRPYPMFA
jgi:hypothetical protein